MNVTTNSEPPVEELHVGGGTLQQVWKSWAGHVASMAEERGACSVLVRKPEESRPLEKPRRGWKDCI